MVRIIALDIETSGLDFTRCGIWQIGAIDMGNPSNRFLQDSRIDPDDDTEIEAMKVTGTNEEMLRDPQKQSQHSLLSNFFQWYRGVGGHNNLCHNPQFDISYLWHKASKYNLEVPFHYRSFDLHSIGQMRHVQLTNDLFGKGNKGMSLTDIINFCNMEDTRKEHNGLEDSMLAGECFSRLVRGENFLSEYAHYPCGTASLPSASQNGMKLMVVHIKATRNDFSKNGIWQIGAVDLENPENQFHEICRIDKDDEVCGDASTQKYFSNPQLQSQQELLENFFAWYRSMGGTNCVSENPAFDTGFILTKARKYNLASPIHYRAFDMHSIAQTKYYQLNQQFLGNGTSDMSFNKIVAFSGLSVEREENNTIQDCILTGESFHRMMYGKPWLEDFAHQPLPHYLV